MLEFRKLAPLGNILGHGPMLSPKFFLVTGRQPLLRDARRWTQRSTFVECPNPYPGWAHLQPPF